MTVQLLRLLKDNRGHWVTMDGIRRVLNLAPSAVHEQIERLRRMGHEIERAPAYGFRLVGHGVRMTAELVEQSLETSRVGRQVLVYDSTDSTNDIAWQYACEGGYDGLAVFADQQRAGRGRLGRDWTAGKGSSILCSVLLEDGPKLGGQILTLIAGLSTAEAVESLCSVRIGIKWPNDITVSGRKLAGVMVESRKINSNFAYVIGIGINCQQRREDFPAEFREPQCESYPPAFRQ